MVGCAGLLPSVKGPVSASVDWGRCACAQHETGCPDMGNISIWHQTFRATGGRPGEGDNLEEPGLGRVRVSSLMGTSICTHPCTLTCNRDLQGRRIRHVTQEKQISSWDPGKIADLRQSAHELTKYVACSWVEPMADSLLFVSIPSSWY